MRLRILRTLLDMGHFFNISVYENSHKRSAAKHEILQRILLTLGSGTIKHQFIFIAVDAEWTHLSIVLA